MNILEPCPKSQNGKHTPSIPSTDDQSNDIHCKNCGRILDPLPSSTPLFPITQRIDE